MTWVPLAAAHAAYHYGKPRVLSSSADDRQPLPQGACPMLTPHEAAVEHLKTLNRADHPEVEELLAVVRQHPVDIQRACEDAVKRGEDSAVLSSVRAVADRQAVELQELLDALTSPAPETSQAAKDIAALRARLEEGTDASEFGRPAGRFTPDAVAGTFGNIFPKGDPLGSAFEDEVARRVAIDEATRHGDDAQAAAETLPDATPDPSAS